MVCPSKPKENKHLGGISQEFGQDIPGVLEKFEKNVCSIFGPLLQAQPHQGILDGRDSEEEHEALQELREPSSSAYRWDM